MPVGLVRLPIAESETEAYEAAHPNIRKETADDDATGCADGAGPGVAVVVDA